MPYREPASPLARAPTIPKPVIRRQIHPSLAAFVFLAGATAWALISAKTLAVMLGFTAVTTLMKMRPTRASDWATEAITLLHLGRLDEAERLLAPVVRRLEHQPKAYTLALYLYADVRLAQGAAAEARGYLELLETAPLAQESHRTSVRVDLILASIATGVTRDLTARVDAVDRGAKKYQRGLVTYARMTVAAFEGRYADALAAYDADPLELEGSLSGGSVRFVRTLRAIALSHTDPGQVAPALAMIGPRRAGELDYLAAGWPELRTFLDLHT
jgi:hypothetical protein